MSSSPAPRRSGPTATVDPDPATQARRCFEIIGQALEDAGASFADVVRSRVYLVDAADFAPISMRPR